MICLSLENQRALKEVWENSRKRGLVIHVLYLQVYTLIIAEIGLPRNIRNITMANTMNIECFCLAVKRKELEISSSLIFRKTEVCK